MTYDWKKSIGKGLKGLVAYGLPFAVTTFFEFYPEITSLTVGSLLLAVANAAKHWNDY